jgi:hypothetical protein
MTRQRMFLYAVAAALLGCDGGDSTGGDAPVATVTVTPDPATVQVGSSVQLTAVLEDADGNQLSGRTVTWSSNAGGTAGVNTEGLVTGVSVGSATMTATSEGRSGTADVEVTTGEPEPLASGAVITLGGEAPTRTALWYDPATRSFHPFDAGSAIPPGSRGLSFGSPSATTSLLFVGGYANVGSAEPSPHGVVLDPETGESEPVVMSAARVSHAVTPLGGTRALVTGGLDAGGIPILTAEIFDEATRTFAFSSALMESSRYGHAAAMLADGRVLVTGGWLGPSGSIPGGPLAETEIYNPATDFFSRSADMSTWRFGHSAITLDDGRVLVLGGYGGGASAEVYDPTAETFTLVGAMSIHGLGHAAVKLQDGRVLVLGGALPEVGPGASAVADLFDPATDSFTRIDDMTTPRKYHFAVVLPNGEVLIGGGLIDDAEILASAEIYDPVADTFTAIEDMPVAATQQAAAAVDR